MEKQSPGPRILLTVPYTRPDYSGSGINALYFAGFLNGRGYSASILTLNRNLRLGSHEVIRGVSIDRIPYYNKNLVLKVSSLFLIIPAYIRWVLRSDVIMIYGAHIIAYQFLIIFGRLAGRKIIFRSLLYGADDLGTLMKSGTWITRRFLPGLFRKIDVYFAISPVFAEAYKNCTGAEQKILISPQGVDVSLFKPAPETEDKNQGVSPGTGESDFFILTVGFLINRKGFQGIFRVLEKLEYPFRYMIAGEFEFGEDHFMRKHAERAAEIREEGIRRLGAKLLLAGPVAEIQDLYKTADLVLINSSSEGMPNTLLEAMASGNVVLVKEIPGIRYLVEHMETGVIFQDETEMYDYLCLLYRDTGLRRKIGRSAARHIRSFASFERVLPRLEDKLARN